MVKLLLIRFVHCGKPAEEKTAKLESKAKSSIVFLFRSFELEVYICLSAPDINWFDYKATSLHLRPLPGDAPFQYTQSKPPSLGCSASC